MDSDTDLQGEYRPYCKFCALFSLQFALQLRHIPTIGTTIPVLSYFESFKFVQGALQILQQGYNKVCITVAELPSNSDLASDQYASREGIFKVAMPDQWLVVVSSPLLIEELRKMPADVADLTGAVHQVCRQEVYSDQGLKLTFLHS